METAKCKLWLKPLFYLIALSFVCSGLIASKNDERFTRMHFGLAQGTFYIGDYEGTLQSLSILLTRHPKHLAALQLKAQTEWQLGMHEESEQTLREAIRIQPDNEKSLALQSTLLRRGKILALLKHTRRLVKDELYEQALSELEKHPDWLMADSQLAKICLSLHLRQENWSSLKQWIQQIPNNLLNANYREYLLGRIQLAGGDLLTAKSHFTAVLKNNPSKSLHRSTLFYQACCTIMDPKMQANGSLEIVHALDAGFRPETLSEFKITSKSLLQQHAPKRALKLLESALNRRVAENALFWLALSRVQLANHNPERAISASTQAISLQVNLVPAYIIRARAHELRQDFEQAKLNYRQALAIQPTRFDIYYALGITHLYSTQVDSAYRAFLNARKGEQANEFWLIFSVLAQANGQLNEAQSALAKYKSLQVTGYSQSVDYLASILNHGADKSLQLHPESSTLQHYFHQFHRGQLSGTDLLKRGLPLQAKRSTSAQKKCALFYWMAQSYKSRKQTNDAQEYYQKAVKTGNPNWIEWHLAMWQLNKSQTTTTR